MTNILSYETLTEFEDLLCQYTGAPYCVLTDSCTHAIELCLRQQNVKSVAMPRHTYISALMVLHKLNIDVEFNDVKWQYEYNYLGSKIWDSARGFCSGMYRPGQMQCLSFGHTKRLQIGHGGAILLDNKEEYTQLKRMAYDGRDLSVAPWQLQPFWKVGYHYNMRLEDAAKGIEMLTNRQLKPLSTQLVEYPDVSKINIEV